MIKRILALNKYLSILSMSQRKFLIMCTVW